MKKTVFALILITITMQGISQQIPKWKIEDVVRSFSGGNDTTYVVNFWATFCKPCIAEIPDFISIVDKYKSKKVKLLLVSLDLPSYYPEKIKAFAKKNNYNTHIAWLNETNADHFCPVIDPKWSGAIPATIIVNNKTGYRKFFEDQVSAGDFEAALQESIKGNVKNKYLAPMNEAKIVDYKSIQSSCPTGCFPMECITFKSKDSSVYSVAAGKVSSVVWIEDMNVVIIQNEKEFYTYSNLGTLKVKRDDIIKPSQLIGYATKNLDGEIALDLYVNDATGKPTELSKDNFITRNIK